MTLPLVDNEPSGRTTGFGDKNQHTRVLLVEDNPNDAEWVRSALAGLHDREPYGSAFHIRSAAELSTAIAYLAEESFDVILLDLSLPDSQSLEQSFSDIHKLVLCSGPSNVATDRRTVLRCF